MVQLRVVCPHRSAVACAGILRGSRSGASSQENHFRAANRKTGKHPLGDDSKNWERTYYNTHNVHRSCIVKLILIYFTYICIFFSGCLGKQSFPLRGHSLAQKPVNTCIPKFAEGIFGAAEGQHTRSQVGSHTGHPRRFVHLSSTKVVNTL